MSKTNSNYIVTNWNRSIAVDTALEKKGVKHDQVIPVKDALKLFRYFFNQGFDVALRTFEPGMYRDLGVFYISTTGFTQR